MTTSPISPFSDMLSVDTVLSVQIRPTSLVESVSDPNTVCQLVSVDVSAVAPASGAERPSTARAMLFGSIKATAKNSANSFEIFFFILFLLTS